MSDPVFGCLGDIFVAVAIPTKKRAVAAAQNAAIDEVTSKSIDEIENAVKQVCVITVEAFHTTSDLQAAQDDAKQFLDLITRLQIIGNKVKEKLSGTPTLLCSGFFHTILTPLTFPSTEWTYRCFSNRDTASVNTFFRVASSSSWGT
jgi:hypothetical protein